MSLNAICFRTLQANVGRTISSRTRDDAESDVTFPGKDERFF